eukprot:g1314.t1
MRRGIDYYRQHFTSCKSTKIAIDATPDYFYNYNDAVENMKLTYGLTTFSELKFIVIVKDPVDRWISFWNHFSQQKFYKGLIEYSSITNATETLMEISDVTPYLDPNNGCQSEGSCFWVNFLIGGLYGKWLRLWLDRGARPEQFEIVFLSELVGTKDGTIKTGQFVSRPLIDRLTDFLNITRFPESQVPRLSKQNHHAHLDTIDDDVNERLDRWYAVGNCYFASVVSKYGIRNWTDMMEASSGWIPSPVVCERLGFNEIGAIDSEYEALPSEYEYENEYNGRSSDADVSEDAVDSEGGYNQGSNVDIPDDVVEDITDSEYERSEGDVSGILLLAIFCLTLVFVVENMKSMYGLTTFSELKFIVIVKDPVQRWLSFWTHFSQQKFYKGLNEYSSITNATETLMETSDVTPYLDPNNGCQSEGSCFGINFLIGGLYGKWLRLWLDRGARPEQFEIVFLSELVGTKDGTIKTGQFVSRPLIDRLTDFLNITRFPESQVPRLSNKNHHAHLDTIDDDVKERLDRWYAVGNCYFASVVSKYGIRNWTDMMEASSGWIPSPAVCERLGFNEIGAIDLEYEALPSEYEYENEYNGRSSDAGVPEDAVDSEGGYNQGSNVDIPGAVVEDITDSEYERSGGGVSGILFLAIFCLALVFVGWNTTALRKAAGLLRAYSRVRAGGVDPNEEKSLLLGHIQNKRSS